MVNMMNAIGGPGPRPPLEGGEDSSRLESGRVHMLIVFLLGTALLSAGKCGCEAVAEYRIGPIRAEIAKCIKECAETGDCVPDGVERYFQIAQCANESLGGEEVGADLVRKVEIGK